MPNVTMYPGDVLTFTPTVTGSDNAAVKTSGYTLSVANNNSSIVQVTMVAATASTGRTATVTALAPGSANLTWTITPSGSYAGGNQTIGPDTITVNAKRTISSASGAYA